jgi:hypothetical protein
MEGSKILPLSRARAGPGERQRPSSEFASKVNIAPGGASGRPAADEMRDYRDDGEHDQDVDEGAGYLEGEQAEQPQDDQDNGDGSKHLYLPSAAKRAGDALSPP